MQNGNISIPWSWNSHAIIYHLLNLVNLAALRLYLTRLLKHLHIISYHLMQNSTFIKYIYIINKYKCIFNFL